MKTILLLSLLLVSACGRDANYCERDCITPPEVTYKGDLWNNLGPPCDARLIYVYSEHGHLYIDEKEVFPGECYYEQFKELYLGIKS